MTIDTKKYLVQYILIIIIDNMNLSTPDNIKCIYKY